MEQRRGRPGFYAVVLVRSVLGHLLLASEGGHMPATPRKEKIKRGVALSLADDGRGRQRGRLKDPNKTTPKNPGLCQIFPYGCIGCLRLFKNEHVYEVITIKAVS